VRTPSPARGWGFDGIGFDGSVIDKSFLIFLYLIHQSLIYLYLFALDFPTSDNPIPVLYHWMAAAARR
jgi:hypothetical protein